MFRKSLLIAACFCLFSAPMAMAQSGSAASNDPGVCYRGNNGTGDVIAWAKSQSQCASTGASGSWVQDGDVRNYVRD